MTPSTKSPAGNEQARALTRKAAATKDHAERERLLRLAFDRELSTANHKVWLEDWLSPIDKQRRNLLSRLERGANDERDTADVPEDESIAFTGNNQEESPELEFEVQTVNVNISDDAKSSPTSTSESDEVATSISVETVEYIGHENSEKVSRSTSPTGARRRPRKLERTADRKASETQSGSTSGSVSPASSRRRPQKLELRQATAATSTVATLKTKKKKPRKLEVRSQGSPG